MLQNEQSVLQAENAAKCDPNKFSIALRYCDGFAAQLNILVCNAAQ